jgi:hypothetical protein
MRGTAWWAALAVAALACAGRASAQEPAVVVVDSLVLPADTVRVRPPMVPGMEACNVSGERLVTDSASLAAVLAFPQCRGAPLSASPTEAVVGLHLWGDCHALFTVDAWRSDAQREYVFRVTHYDGGCRAMGRDQMRWYGLPALPPGWRVAVTFDRRERYP